MAPNQHTLAGNIKEAANHLEKALETIKEIQYLSGNFADKKVDSSTWSMLEKAIVHINKSVAMAFSATWFHTETTSNRTTNQAKIDRGICNNIFQCDWISPNIICARFPSPPQLKTMSGHRSYKEFFKAIGLENVLQAAQNMRNKWDAVTVIYVNQYCKDSVKKQPYFDNDNIEIKYILDILVPTFCVDDAYLFCNNMYLAQPGEASCSKVFIVKNGAFSEWLQLPENKSLIDYFK